ncbi:hypothetical protein Pmar_PMAR006238 [Perkinsus marinus ATCC 50983]|uniref:Uncharacterized protein n=1 Tax=Perkinsus marinus (strain ATCC 50983 / TXsc) TaxID=423536 RepID=C5LAH1_PERM5|nr:hypothetical protein Pmar_PMAR006238 [Perkinsus marinus ATCC 50983]EER06427.1 hypothetical protein Pmar_PMAR006238 [Perkinsus marinus ATCC 50983]|eukprot:XP_002774611.1 hypothetical protein Pmar_PMAR006238 [Perkinsus marinus ATCC 50983]
MAAPSQHVATVDKQLSPALPKYADQKGSIGKATLGQTSAAYRNSLMSQPSTIQFQPEVSLASALPSYGPRRGSRFEALFQDALNRQERQRVRKEERRRVEDEEINHKNQRKARRSFDMAKFKRNVDADVRHRQERKAHREAQRIEEKHKKDREAVRVVPAELFMIQSRLS